MVQEKCKLCGDDLKYIFEANQCRLAKCCRCDFVQVIDLDNVAEYQYNEQYFTNSKYKDKSAQEKEYFRRKKIVKKYLPKGRILDCGCAAGEFVQYISGEGIKADGCDISQDAIMIAKERYPSLKRHFCCIGQLGDKKYDAVCLWDVIEHLPNPHEIMLKLRSEIKDNGYVFISTPNIGAGFAKILKRKWPFMTPPEHLSFFSRKSISYLAKISGMTIVDWKTKGKWANVGFVLYKFNRVSNIKIPSKIIQMFQTTFLSKWKVYVPTGDIQYVVLKKKCSV